MRHLRTRTGIAAALAGLIVAGLGATPASAEEVCLPVTADAGVCVEHNLDGTPYNATVSVYDGDSSYRVIASVGTGHVLQTTFVCIGTQDDLVCVP